MPKSEKATTGRAKRAVKEGGRKKKGTFLTSSPTTSLSSQSHANLASRPQPAQAWSLCLHVLRQRAARQGPRGQPRHQVRYVVSHSLFNSHCLHLPGEVGKKLGEQWKSLSDKQKEPYDAKAKADKQRYEEEKAAYTAVSLPLPLPLTTMTNTIQGGVDDDEDED